MAAPPKAQTVDEPCSACGQRGVLFSTRQAKVAPSKRKCLDCMGNSGKLDLAPEQPPPTGADNVPAPQICDDPCSACGLTGVLFSTRQSKVEASIRKCLDCMALARAEGTAEKPRAEKRPLAIPHAQPRVTSYRVKPAAQLQPAPPVNLPAITRPGAAVSSRLAYQAPLAPVAAVRAQPRVAVHPVAAVAAPPLLEAAIYGGKDAPNPQACSEPCSACGRVGVLFSRRQSLVAANTRKCLDCMPAMAGQPPPPAIAKLPKQELTATPGICKDFERGLCARENCKFSHEPPPLNFQDHQTIRFSPGRIGIGVIGNENRVETVDAGTQAEAAGVAVGWHIIKVNGLRYSAHNLLDDKAAGDMPYEVTFATQEAMLSPQQFTAPEGACKDFLNGRCNRGDSCKFAHIDPSLGEEPMLSPQQITASAGACKDFLNGKCNRGDLCKFAHIDPGLNEELNAPAVCKDFQFGRCARGDACVFLHIEDPLEQELAASQVCRDFENGKCSRGASCRFAHVLAEQSHLSQASLAGEICRDFQNGTCARGAGCRFSHGAPVASPMPMSSVQILAASGERKDFLNGRCTRGAACKFAHASSQVPPRVNPIVSGGAVSRKRKAEALEPGLGVGKDPPAENFLDDPCSSCGLIGVPFSNRQMAKPTGERRCLSCMSMRPAVAQTAALAEVEVGLNGELVQDDANAPCSACGASGPFSNRQKKVPAAKRRCVTCMPGAREAVAAVAPLIDETTSGFAPPKENLAAEPCSVCLREGAVFSNRQMKVPAEQRKCLECMTAMRAGLDSAL